MMRFPELGKSIFFVMETKKGGIFRQEIVPPHAVGFVLRSWVAPLRCPLSYTSAKLGKVFVTSKFSAEKIAKSGKVSH